MYGYPQQPPPRSGPSALVIVLIVLGVLAVLGGGACLVCVGLAASATDSEEAPAASVAPASTPVVPATPSAGPRVVDFACPPGKPPGGAVRAGCLCGNEILGTACGAPGNFTDVVETPRGCRFTCQ